MHPRTEMLDLIVIDGRARGIVARDLVTGEIATYFADAVVLATGGYGNVFYLSTNAKNSNATAIWRAHRRGAYFANPCFTQIHPTCIPRSGDHQSKLTLMSESLRNDGRIWVPKAQGRRRARRARSPRTSATTTWSGSTRPSATSCPATSPPAPRRTSATRAAASGPAGRASTSTSPTPSRASAATAVEERYGNLFEMYERITAEDPYSVPMRIYPAIHYTMGGLWVDYDLQTTVPGLFAIGEANFSDHGANRLGASALMQGLADGYFVLPATLGDYLARNPHAEAPTPGTRRWPRPSASVDGPAASGCSASTATAPRVLPPGAGRTPVGRMRHGAYGDGLRKALDRIPSLREEFWRRVKVPGTGEELNQSLEKANRIADYLELAELMCLDALHRAESCGGHFREESQTPDGEALRDDDDFSYAAAWESPAPAGPPVLHKEDLVFEYVHPTQRSYAVKLTLRIWRQRDAGAHGADGHLRGRRTSRRTCRSWRCWTPSTRS